MFQFTTTTVINSDRDSSGKPMWTANDNSFYVKRVNEFKKDNITVVYKAVPVEPKLASIAIDLDAVTGVKTGDNLRINIYIGLSEGSNDPIYANDFYFKGRPMTFDFTWMGSADKTAEALKKTIRKYQLNIYGEKMVDVKVEDSVITLTATTEYQRFRRAALELLDAEAWNNMGEYKEIDDAVTVISEGQEGFGTYSWILHNLRIPTTAHTDAWSINQKEMPIPGAKYTQFTLHYCVDRGTLGLNAVGHQVTSATTHVFYVKEDLVSSFESALKSVGGITVKEVTIPTSTTSKVDAEEEVTE